MKEKIVLIFEPDLNGHRLEYLHHIYSEAILHLEVKFVFAIPSGFKEKDISLNWPKSSNITFHLLEDLKKSKVSLFTHSYYMTKQIKKLCLEYNVSSVFLIVLMAYMPFLPFVVPKGVSISGIIYNIYLYRWKKSNLYAKTQDIMKYILFSKFNKFKSIFILNDKASAFYLNKLYKTSHFRCLPDPLNRIKGEPHDIRVKLKIPKEKRILLHFGGLCKAKGTIEILDAIDKLDNPEKYCFIFAGKIYDDILDEFKRRISVLSRKCQIICLEGFQPYETILSLCSSCDAILTPYKRSSQSSGCIGYAAQFKKAVVAPKWGLLGRLVRRYHLGVLIDEVSGVAIANGIRKTVNWSYTDNSYLKDNQIINFQKNIMDVLLN